MNVADCVPACIVQEPDGPGTPPDVANPGAKRPRRHLTHEPSVAANYGRPDHRAGPCHSGVTVTQYPGKVSVVSTPSEVLWTTAVMVGKQT